MRAYNLQTRTWIDEHLNDLHQTVLQMAIEHRFMHAETLAYLMHDLPYADKLAGPAAAVAGRLAPANPLVDIAGSSVQLGIESDKFGWDNEYLAHQVNVSPFRS